MSTSVWPSDYLKELNDIERENANQLIVFLASPFNPKDRYDDLLNYCQQICDSIGKNRAIDIKCHRGDTPSSPNIIHQDIWDYIQRSDAIIIDISEKNYNVMIELGVAMAIRDKNKIILLQDADSEESPIFDISPARYLKYHRSLTGDLVFSNRLKKALEFSLAPAPFITKNEHSLDQSSDLKLSLPTNSEQFIGPANSHRRISNEGLEFGSFYFFQYSWLTLGLYKFRNVRIQAEIKFTEVKPYPSSIGGQWIGISLRNQHFYSDYGHLVYLSSDGCVRYTKPIDEYHKDGDDPLIGKITNFSLNEWVNFDLQFDENVFSISVNDIKQNIPTIDMPFLYNTGFIRFQTYQARACIATVQIEIPR